MSSKFIKPTTVNGDYLFNSFYLNEWMVNAVQNISIMKNSNKWEVNLLFIHNKS